MTTLQICGFCFLAFMLGIPFGIAVGFSAEQSRAEDKEKLAAKERYSSQLSKFYSPELLRMIKFNSPRPESLFQEQKYTFSESGLRSLLEETRREERIKVREEYYDLKRKARKGQE